MNTRWRNLSLFSPADSLRLAARFPRCAAAVIRDTVLGFRNRPFPRRIGLFLTDRCNFACPMCAVIDARNQGSRRADLPFPLVEKVYRESGRHGPVLDLIGGEPLLYGEIEQVFRLASGGAALSVLTTNGLLLSDFVDPLVRCQVPVVQVSLDGWDEESQRLRGNVRNSFARIVEGVTALLRARGHRRFPLVRILTAITRNNFACLDRIQQVVHSLGVRDWGVANYFFVTRTAQEAHRAFALQHGLTGFIAADAIQGDRYLTPAQVRLLRASLDRVREVNRRLRLRIAYNWGLAVEKYYSPAMPSRRSCDLPYNRLDIHTDGGIAVCVSGKTIGNFGRESLREVWQGRVLAGYRGMYEASKPMPMCFRCCGMSNSIQFD